MKSNIQIIRMSCVKKDESAKNMFSYRYHTQAINNSLQDALTWVCHHQLKCTRKTH